jgi:hypothetical protein
MKRVLLLILLVMLVAWFVSVREEVPIRRQPETQPVDVTSRSISRSHREAQRAAIEAHRQAQEAARQAREEARHAIAQAHHDVRAALDEAAQDVRRSLQEVGDELRETVEDIPVPIVSGTRVDQAVPNPPALPQLPARPLAEAPVAPPALPAPPAPPGFPGLVKKHGPAKVHRVPQPPPPPAASPQPRETRDVTGLVSATEQRAREEARKELDRQVTDWLESQGVPRSWRPSSGQVDGMIVESKMEPVVKDYGTLYVAHLRVDVSPERRTGFVQAYQRQLVHRRLVLLGGGLAFLLTCLGALSGYIRADEATKGYYTNRLRLLAAAGVGAVGATIYHMIT